MDLMNVAYENDTRELTRNYTMNLHRKLKERVKAGVFCKEINGVVIVRLKVNDKVWEYAIPNVMDRIISGEDDTIVLDEILKEYRRYILSYYFYGRVKDGETRNIYTSYK